MKMWSTSYSACLNCSSTDIKHKGHGLCRLCYGRSEFHKNSSNKWRSTDKGKLSYREYNKLLKLKAMEVYSKGEMKCLHCGFNDLRALALDHINNDGASLRKTYNTTTYAWLRTKNYPDGYQVLCMNCNWIKEVERKKYATA